MLQWRNLSACPPVQRKKLKYHNLISAFKFIALFVLGFQAQLQCWKVTVSIVAALAPRVKHHRQLHPYFLLGWLRIPVCRCSIPSYTYNSQALICLEIKAIERLKADFKYS